MQNTSSKGGSFSRTAALNGSWSWVGVRGHRSKVSANAVSLSKNTPNDFSFHGAPASPGMDRKF